MQPQVEKRHLPRQNRMEEAGNGNALPAQAAIGGGAQKSAAEATNQDAGSHSSAMGSDQRADELQADFVGPEDVGGKPNVIFRALDGGEHLRVGLIAAMQGRNHFAGRQVLTGDFPDGDLEPLERVVGRNVARDRTVNARNGSH